MKFINEKRRSLLLSKEEFGIIANIISCIFSLQIDWQYEACIDKNSFSKKFEEKFAFKLIELDCVVDQLCELRDNLMSLDLKDIYLFFPREKVPNKLSIIYTALTECAKNYKDYEVSAIAGISKQELDDVLKEFKEKVIDVIKAAQT